MSDTTNKPAAQPVPRFSFLDVLQAQAQAYQAGIEDGGLKAQREATDMALERDSLLWAARVVLTSADSLKEQMLAFPGLILSLDQLREAVSGVDSNHQKKETK
jgi:hypothetical protein